MVSKGSTGCSANKSLTSQAGLLQLQLLLTPHSMHALCKHTRTRLQQKC